ncbi:Alpha/Beta hydrolase protein [Endogone sp. FLAS-F59071]|nr:Alpha/Beta hydrolase protein [Endogone sp. FLAS-F59071]|eukprot:RUS15075.1 Alpha/Beta hydrolase protein [Endogone sp. FLAS-F59071]
MSDTPVTKHVQVPDGQIGYQIYDPVGIPPATVVCIPGMGDIASLEYELLIPHLLRAGYRVFAMDIRGNGLSAGNSFQAFDVPTMASDLRAILDAEEVESCFLAANSISGCTAALFAIDNPERVKALLLFGPVFDTGSQAMTVILSAIVRIPFIGSAIWISYFKSLYPLHPLNKECLARAQENIRQPGAVRALAKMFTVPHLDGRIKEVGVPSLVFLGTKDPDFSNVKKEAEKLRREIPNTKVVTIEGAGHYVHREVVEEVVNKAVEWLEGLMHG